MKLATYLTKKKDVNNNISFAQLKHFLCKYWEFMKHAGTVDSNSPFPEERLNYYWRRVGNDENTVSLDQFRTMFFLFCNTTAPDTPCPHGQKERIQAAAQQLHNQFSTNIFFENETFEKVFAEIDHDHDGILTCAESELLFYLYSSEVMKNIPIDDIDTAAPAPSPVSAP